MIKKNKNRGVTLIELLLYCSILTTILMVIFELFIQTSLSRLSSINENAILLNSQKILFDLGETVRGANSITLPIIGQNGSTLTLNNGQVTYQLDETGNLTKKENLETNKLNNSEVTIENLNFKVLGPSIIQSTVKVSFTLKATILKQGKERKEDFQTSISLR